MDPVCLAFSRGCCFYDATSCPHGRHDIFTDMVPLHMAAPPSSHLTSRATSPHSVHERSINGRDRSDHSRYDSSDHGRYEGSINGRYDGSSNGRSYTGSISMEEKKRPSSGSVLRTSFSSTSSSVVRTNQTRPSSSATSTLTSHRKPSMTAVVRPSTATATTTMTKPVSIAKASTTSATITTKPTPTQFNAAVASAATATATATSSTQSAVLTDSNLQKHQRNTINTRLPPPPPTIAPSVGKYAEKDHDQWLSDNRSEAEISVISEAFSTSYGGSNANAVFPKPGQPRFMKNLVEMAELLIIKLQYLTRPDVLAELLLLVRLEGACQDVKMILEALNQRRYDTSHLPPSLPPSLPPPPPAIL